MDQVLDAPIESVLDNILGELGFRVQPASKLKRGVDVDVLILARGFTHSLTRPSVLSRWLAALALHHACHLAVIHYQSNVLHIKHREE